MSRESPDDDGHERLSSRLRPDEPGRAFGVAAAVGVASVVLSLLALVAYALSLPEGAEVPLINPIVIVGIGSWAGVVVSLFGYAIWGIRQLRANRSSDYPNGWSAEESDVHPQRERRVLFTLCVAVLFLLIPFAMVVGGPANS